MHRSNPKKKEYSVRFLTMGIHDERLVKPARAVVQESLGVKAGERVLIVTNPGAEIFRIASAVYDAAAELGARPVLVVQPRKTSLDYAEDAVIEALASEPEVFCSLSEEKLGKDRRGLSRPYVWEGKEYDHIHGFLREGKKVMRSFWSPSLTLDTFLRTVDIDYEALASVCRKVKARLEGAVEVHVTSPSGTDLRFSVEGRTPFLDDGLFREPGEGGNLPAGEVFVSPVVGSAEGMVAFDGSIALAEGIAIPSTPVRVTFEEGYVVSVEGEDEAAELLSASLEAGKKRALAFEQEGLLPRGQGEVYARNARHLGEFGIGLNEKARIVGNMLEDEKVYGTCHFAIGSNYDEDAKALIHLDALVKNPTIRVRRDSSWEVLMEEGTLVG
ncbi:putative leucyl aminopeptidase [Spirochaeta thermophila DSM 6192]|uniref:Putative leucyl aminopeptidase n=1 Tax=Winmispira thermophila (strain ATCC 49972 / DSM 6192 / RI 19.B1) TaxID=665571 RepID=E0RNA1_WINT6|nr:putative leucyl aminopeptidase [Spirochaeta thermophila DSM 6192]